MRRFRKAVLILSILTLVVLAGLYLSGRAYLASDGTRRQVESQLAEMYGGPVAVESASVGMVGDSSLHGVRLYEAGGSESAPWAIFESVQSDVSALDILRGKTPQAVTLTGAAITLNFDAKGKLITQLPETKSKGGNFPTIQIEQAKVILRQEGRPEMVVTGVQAELHPKDGQLILSGTITDDHWGRWSLDGKVDTAASSLTTTLKTDRADVTQEKLDRLPVIPKAVWDVVNTSGPTPVEFTYRHEPGAQLPDRYRVVLNPDGAAIDIKERNKDNSGILLPGRDVHGRIVIEDGEVRLEGVSGSAFGGSIQTDAKLDFRGKETTLDFSRLKFGDVEIAQLPPYWKEKLPSQFRNLDGWLSGSANGTIAVGEQTHTTPNKPTSYLDINVRLRDVDLAEFVKGLDVKLSFPVEGKLTLDVQASLPVDTKAYRVKGTATASRLVISGVEMKDVMAKIRYDSGVLQLDELTGSLPAKPEDGTFKGHVRLGVVPEGDLTASLTFDRLPLSQFRGLAGGREDLSGTVTGSAEVGVPAGKLRDPAEWMVDALVRADRVGVYGLTVEKGTATARARKGVLKITDLDATLEGAGINGSAEANLTAPYRYSVKLALKKGDLASLNKLAPDLHLPEQVEGSIAATADLTGTLSPFAVQATGSATGSDLKIQAVRVAALRFNWSVEDGLKLSDVRAALYEGEVTGTATVPMDAKQVGTLDLRFENVDVGSLVRDIPAIPLKLEGKAGGSIKGGSPAAGVGERTYDADLELQAPKLRVQNFSTEKLIGTVSYRKGVAEYHLKGGLLGGTFDLDGRIPQRPEPEPAKPEPEGRLRINNATRATLGGHWWARVVGSTPRQRRFATRLPTYGDGLSPGGQRHGERAPSALG